MQSINFNINQRLETALIQLRQQKHQAGFPFMITDGSILPDNQAFMEYQDGKIEVVEFTKNYEDYFVIRSLNAKESIEFRKKYKLN